MEATGAGEATGHKLASLYLYTSSRGHGQVGFPDSDEVPP